MIKSHENVLKYLIKNDYSGPDRATCPEFESHPSGDREPPILEFESHFLTQVT